MEAFAPIAKAISIRMLLTYTTKYDLNIIH